MSNSRVPQKAKPLTWPENFQHRPRSLLLREFRRRGTENINPNSGAMPRTWGNGKRY